MTFEEIVARIVARIEARQDYGWMMLSTRCAVWRARQEPTERYPYGTKEVEAVFQYLARNPEARLAAFSRCAERVLTAPIFPEEGAS